MMTVEMDMQSVRDLERAVKLVSGSLDQQFASAVNKAAGRTKTQIAKRITARLNAAQKHVKSNMPRPPRATKSRPSTVVTLQKSRRLGLHMLKGTTHKKSGVGYTVETKGARKTIVGAFMGPRPGRKAAKLKGLVAKRIGRRAYPLRFPKGVSPWGMFVVHRMDRDFVPELERVLKKEVEKRTRAMLVKAGLIG